MYGYGLLFLCGGEPRPSYLYASEARMFQRVMIGVATWILFVFGIPGVCIAANIKVHQSDSTASPTGQVRTYHSGSIRDLQAIGNRNVGCGRGLGNWYSFEKQIAIGKTYGQQVESTSKLVSDPIITEYINRVGQNLVRNSDAQVPFTIKVIDSDDIM